MKTATLPALRVSPVLREAAQRALRPDETLSRFMEASLERYVAHRAAEDDFIARGLRSASAARESQRYQPAAAVLDKLASRLAKATAKTRVSSPGMARIARKSPTKRK